MESLDDVYMDSDDKMTKSLSLLQEQFSGIRTGKASPALVENVKVSYYRNPTRLKELASIATPEARLIVIHPYDPTSLPDIEKAILAANLGVTPMNDGRVIRVPIPELTKERRAELTKVAKTMAEDCRVAIRNVRRDANEHIKKLEKDHKISQDDRDAGLKEIQKETDLHIKKVDDIFKIKEESIMAV
ncbi:MAG: ribosome recycling factor [Verrucomicrobiota bacterium]|nr:ribosome recycling factor [Verrucomicrobiota bacterium]